jgi:hypothetical protein
MALNARRRALQFAGTGPAGPGRTGGELRGKLGAGSRPAGVPGVVGAAPAAERIGTHTIRPS